MLAFNPPLDYEPAIVLAVTLWTTLLWILVGIKAALQGQHFQWFHYKHAPVRVASGWAWETEEPEEKWIGSLNT